jgi:hypothetical protein
MIFHRLRLYILQFFSYAINIFTAAHRESRMGGEEISDEKKQANMQAVVLAVDPSGYFFLHEHGGERICLLQPGRHGGAEKPYAACRGWINIGGSRKKGKCGYRKPGFYSE